MHCPATLMSMVFAPVSSMTSVEAGTPLGFQLLASPSCWCRRRRPRSCAALKLTMAPRQSPPPVPFPVVEYVPVDETTLYAPPVANEPVPVPILVSSPVVKELVHGLRTVPPTCEAPPKTTSFARVVVRLPVWDLPRLLSWSRSGRAGRSLRLLKTRRFEE